MPRKGGRDGGACVTTSLARPQHSVSVAAVIVDDDNRVLAVRRRDNGEWHPPGGVLELDETIVDGLVREVREEAGLIVEPEFLTGIYKHVDMGVLAMVFRCRPLGVAGPPSPDETRDVRWLTPAQIDDYMMGMIAVRVRDALEHVRPEAGHRMVRFVTHNGSEIVPAEPRLLPVGPDRPRRVEGARDAVAIRLPVTGQEDGVDALEAV
jgi:8-oxo-dGTP diphosphatase